MKNQRSTTLTKPEILAPAGGMPQLIAAVENGADAVYLGGPSFNARMQAGNFDEETFREAVRYAHVRGVKIYVTMNTLLTDEDLPAAWEAAKQMYAAGADGFIIQDLGLGRMLREHLPGAKLHLSTQATVYNLEGVRTAAALGYERVVLSRELTLPEIREICAAGLAEIEVFVHGALCMCYSGQCQMSRAIGGRSANKGACAQPCRLPYRDETGRTAHFLSPKDMCQIDHLGELTEAGVRSFKIEGRMKSPEYVATVVRIYRKYLDLFMEYGGYTVNAEDKESLLKVFNREGFSDAYYKAAPESVCGAQAMPFTGKDIKRMMALATPKNSGLYAGRILRQKGVLADVRLDRPVGMGDVIEIRPADGLGRNVTATVTYLKPLAGRPGQQGETVRLGDVKERVLPEDKVYLIRDARLMEQAQKASLPNTRRVPVQMRFGAVPGAPAWLSVCCADGQAEVRIRDEAPCEKAQSKGPDLVRIEEQLRKTGGTPFEADRVDLFIDGSVFLPVSVINRLRREALEQLEEELGSTAAKAGALPVDEKQLIEDIEKRMPLEAPAPVPEEARRFSVVTRGAEDEELARIAAFAEQAASPAAGEQPPVYLNNPGWIKRLVDAGVTVWLGEGLNVTNRQAARALKELGARVAAYSPEELPQEQVRDLMITEYPILAKTLTDRKGVTYLVEGDPKSRRHYIRRR